MESPVGGCVQGLRQHAGPGQPAIQLEPFFESAHITIGASAFLGEAVAAGLEDVEFDGNPGLAPGAEQIERSLVTDGLAVGRHYDEQRGRACW